MRRTVSKKLRRKAEQYIIDAVNRIFPEEANEDLTKEMMWKQPFKQTHFLEKFESQTRRDEEGNFLEHSRIRLYNNSPREVYKRFKKEYKQS